MPRTRSKLSRSNEWRTDPYFFMVWHRRFRFTVDAAAAPWNHQVPRFWTARDNGLAQDWRNHVVWWNPPYSRGQPEAWSAHARRATLECGTTSCGLLPARTADGWFRRNVVRPEGQVLRVYPVSTLLKDTAIPGFVTVYERLVVELHFPPRLTFTHESGYAEQAPSSHVVIAYRPPGVNDLRVTSARG